MDPAITLKDLKYAIEEGDIDKLKEKVNEYQQERKKICQPSTSQCVTQTDLILAACRNKQVDILHYLLNETDILDQLPGADYKAYKDAEVQRQRTEAFKHALIWDAFPMVEMLYDYWADDLHWIGHDINKIKTLGKLLDDARVVCVVETQQLKIDVHSLSVFNAFQRELYSRINLISKTTSEDTASMLLEMLCIYDEYSKIENVRLPIEDDVQEKELQDNFNDNTSEYMRGIQAYISYEFYYRKLDFNVALLILDNSFVLRRDLKERFNQSKIFFATNPEIESSYQDAVSLYKNIECALYHFIYCTCEDWRLYLPRDRKKKLEEQHGIHNGRIIFPIITTSDEHKLNNGPILFLERKNFKKCVNDLKDLLHNHIMSVDPAIAWAQTHKEKISKVGNAAKKNKILLNDNYFTPTMHMSDYYLLFKIVYYIKANENTQNINVLIIERIRQVTQEMLKSTLLTYHLSDPTKSLLQIPVNTIKHLRTLLSKVLKRIDIAKNQDQVFHDIKKDLKIIEQMIEKLLDDNNLTPTMHLSDYYSLCKIVYYIKAIENTQDINVLIIERILQVTGEMLKSTPVSYHLSYPTKSLLQIPVDTIEHLSDIRTFLSKVYKGQLSTRIDIAKNQAQVFHDIKKDLKIIGQMINSVLDIYKHILDKALLEKGLALLDEQIKNMSISSRNIDVIDDRYKTHGEKLIESETCAPFLQELSDDTGLTVQLLKEFFWIRDNKDIIATKIKSADTNICDGNVRTTSFCKNLAENNTFDGIKKLHEIFKRNKKKCPPRDELISFLFSRVNLLKVILQYPQVELEQNRPKYKHDKTFRFGIEMIMADLANILGHCNKPSHQDKYQSIEITKKSEKLLREIDIGNLLDHGNPFLDVIADVFDSYDLSTALLSKAKMFAKDGESIEALLKLFQGNIHYDTIKNGNLTDMNDDQKTLYKVFTKSPNWRYYVEVVPKNLS